MYTPLSITDYKFTYEESLAQKQKKVLACFWVRTTFSRVKRAFSETVLCACQPRENAQVYSGGSYDTNAFMLNWQYIG